MADKEINMRLTVDDKGSTKKKTEEARALREELEKASKVAENMGEKKGSSALTKAKERALTPRELVEYNSQRGSAGAAGGTARDFAAQAQGLGGLVRLYATFAANIYAVSTAFNALKEAANVDKMIESSTRFSIVTGNNLNSIAKDLQKATDSTLAFQDAIKFTNIGTAAGLSGKEIKNLTVIAKGAATALGRDVGESIQRIIQGTAKQEQEILDELGIFVKSKKAFEEYAQARNIKVDDLTARQRTLAYAEAVAKAGEQWKEFATVEDPYAKLMASGKEALQETLSLVNKIVTPIVKLFADSADAIKALGLLITTVLVKKALPELKNALSDALSFKNVAAVQRTKEAKDALVKEYTDLNAKLLTLKEKRDSLMSFDLSKEGQMTLLGSRVDPNAIQRGAGSNIDYGLSLKRASTAIFGSEKEPVDLAKYKTVTEVQDKITQGLREQLKEEKTRDTVLQSLIAKKVVEEGSTYKNLVLTQNSKKFAEETLGIIQLINNDSAKRNALEKEYLVTTKQVALAKKNLEKANILPENAVDPNFMGPPTRAGYEAAQKMTMATNMAIGSVDAYRASILASSKAMDIYNSKATGMLASVSAFGGYLGSFIPTLAASSAGLSGLSKAGAIAGTAMSFLGGTLSIVARGFLAALGPLSLLWTAWELFGDSLKQYIPFIKWTTKEMELQKEAYTALTESMQTSSAALERNIQLVSQANGDIDKLAKGLEGQANAYRSVSNALDEYNRKIEEGQTKYGAGKGPEDLAKKYGKSNVEAVTQVNSVVSILQKAQESGELTAAQSVKASEAVYELGKALKDLEKGAIGPQTINNLLKSTAPLVKESTDQVGTALENRLAITQRAKSAAESISKVAQDIDDKKLEAQAKGLKGDTQALAVYKSLTALTREYALAKEKADKQSISNKQAQVIAELINKTRDLKVETKELAEARMLIADISVWEGVAAAAGTNKAALDTANTQLALLKTRLINVTSGTDESRKAMASLVVEANETTGKVKELTEAEKAEIAVRKQKISQIEAANQALQLRISLEDKLNSIISKATDREEEGVNASKVRLIQEESNLARKKADLARFEAIARAPSGKAGDSIRKEAESTYKLELDTLSVQQNTKLTILELESIQARLSNKLKEANEVRTRETDLIALKNKLEDASAEGVNKEATRRLETLNYLKEEIDLYNLKLDREKLILDARREADQLERDRQAKLQDASISFSAARETAKSTLGEGSEAYKTKMASISTQQEEVEARINSQFTDRLTLMQGILNVQLERNSVDAAYVSILAKQSKELAKVSKVSSSIEGLFEGTSLQKQAKVFSDLLKSSTSGKQRLAKLDDQEKARKEKLAKLEEDSTKLGFTSSKELAKMREEDAELSKKYTDEKKAAELDLAITTISSFKSMMSEKTAGYKVLNTIEKAMHIYKMTVAAIELATDIKNTAVSVANSTTRIGAKTVEAGVDAVGAVIKAISSLPFPANLVAGAATAAVVFSLLSSIGGKGKQVSTAGSTAKDRQETQGTGMRWVDGKKVETGGGVFGNSEAKSESIRNSLEVIKDNSIEGLSFDNKMLKALESIDKAISGVSTSLYRVPGIRTGSAFGTVEGTTKGNSTLQNFVSQLFGNKSVSKEIIDSGVKIAGNFKELAKGTQGLINFYETVQTTTTKSKLFGLSKSTSTSIETSTKGAPPEITQAVSSIFSYATGLFKDVGSKIGKTAEEIDTQLGSINFDQLLSLRDLKGEDLEKEFNAVISSMLDSTADALFSEMKRFQKFGEGMLETVVRVVDANRKLNEGLNAIGQSSALKSVGKTLDYDITEKLLEAVGGLETFTDQIQFFRDEFLTEAERIAPVAKAVRDEMERLGYGLVDTRAEFKSLVQSLDLTVPAQQELYASLMLVAKSFAEVYEETEKLLDAEEYRNKVIGLEISGLKALGLTTMAVAAEREAELAELNKLAPAQRDQLVYYQKVLYAIEDAMEVRNAEIEVLGALGFTYDQLILQREVEMMGMTDQLRAVKKWQNAVEDYNASQDLMIELLGKVGDGTKATAIIRERELKGLNATDKAIKRAIYALEDEAAIRDKLKEIREEETSTLKDNISATRDYIKSLKDYRSSLLTGNLSPLNPLQKYEQTKSEVMALAAKASAPAVTEEDKRAQKEARDKLQSSTNAWLEASRVLFASSTAYTSDFNTVLSIVDKAIASAEGALSDAEQQLQVLKQSEALLGGIEENTKTSAQLMAELSAAQERTAAALANVPEDLASVYKMDELYAYIATLPQAIQSLPQALTDAINSVVPLGNAYLPSIPGLPGAGFVGPLPGPGYTAPNIPALGEPDPAIVEIKGYTIEGNDLTRQLINEVTLLRNEVVSLKSEARDNTNALVSAEIKSGIVTGEVVANGVAGAVNAMAWQNNNVVTLR